MIVKDMVKALWGDNVLANRSYGDRVDPKNKGKEAAVARTLLTPNNVDFEAMV